MKNPFRSSRKNREEAWFQQMGAHLKEQDERYRRLEEALVRLHAKPPQVTIENVHIHQPVLEKLEFRLDGLDIEHLSGSLNLGNNFGTKIRDDVKASSPGTGGTAPASPGLHRTPSGFRFSNRR